MSQEQLKINKEEIENAKNQLTIVKDSLNDYPGYDLKTIFKKSQGPSKKELIVMFESLDKLKNTMITSFEKTIQALDRIENNFETFDQTFANTFKK